MELTRLGDYQRAQASCRKAITLKPHDAKAHNNLALVYKAQGDTRRAFELLRQALALEPDYADARQNLEDILAEDL